MLGGSTLIDFVPWRPKTQKYTKMIHDLANAIAQHPFNMQRGARYLHDWVDEKLACAAPVTVNILEMIQPTFVRPAHVHSTAVVGLEPEVSTIRVLAAAGGTGPVTTPKMTVIGGMATTLRDTSGLTWSEAFTKAFELWEKLNTNIVASLTLPEGNVR